MMCMAYSVEMIVMNENDELAAIYFLFLMIQFHFGDNYLTLII